MYLFSLLVSFFGLFGLVRSIRVLISLHFSQLFSHQASLFAIFVTHFLLNIILSGHLWLLICLNTGCFLIGPLCIQAQEWFHARNSTEKMASILDLLIIRISSGGSFRQSLQHIQADTVHFNHLMKEIIHAITTNSPLPFPKHSSAIAGIITELQSIDRSSFKTLDKLKNLRDSLRLQLKFKRKVQQASLQVRMQTFILSFIYLGLVVLSFLYFERSSFLPWLSLSTVLFAMGAAWSWKIGRSFKWKI